MAPKIDSERRGELLVIRLKGTIGFSEPDFAMRDRLVELLREQVGAGASQLLIDYSRTSFLYPSSYELGVFPLLQARVSGEVRVAACSGNKPKGRTGFQRARVDSVLDCFDSEAAAIDFLQSHTPMTKRAAGLDDRLWAAIGPEIGPAACKREGCDHLRVGQSLFCKRHHYEMVRGTAYKGMSN